MNDKEILKRSETVKNLKQKHSKSVRKIFRAEIFEIMHD
jgi:hypothetical protein